MVYKIKKSLFTNKSTLWTELHLGQEKFSPEEKQFNSMYSYINLNIFS